MLSKEFVNIVKAKGYVYKKYKIKNEINKNTNIKISVLIPVYNGEKTIKRCIESLKNQTLNNNLFEIIIVNDGSTDSTLEILKKYSNIKIINQKNKGISRTRNVCLREANGEYIAFIDSDDYVEENYLKRLLDCAENEKLDFVKCGYNKIKNEKLIYKNQLINKSGFERLTDDELYLDGYLWGALFKKKLLKNISFPDEYWFEDMITKTLIYSRIKSYRIISDNLYNYIDSEKSATKIQGKKKSIKNLDEIFLIDEIVEYKSNLNEKFDSYFKQVILYELWYVLPIRIKNLPNDLKRKSFYESCNIVKRLNISKKEKIEFYKVFEKRKFLIWKYSSIARRLIKKMKTIIKSKDTFFVY